MNSGATPTARRYPTVRADRQQLDVAAHEPPPAAAGSARIAGPRPARPENLGDHPRVEAQPRLGPSAEAQGAEFLGVLIDPRARDPEAGGELACCNELSWGAECLRNWLERSAIIHE